MAATVFDAHMLPDPRCGRRDVQLLAHVLADTVQRTLAACAKALIFREVMFDTLARQVLWQRFAPTLLRHRWCALGQARIGHRHCLKLRRGSHLLCFVEHPLAAFLAAGGEALELRQTELFFQLAHARRQLRIACFEVADVGLDLRRQVGERVLFVHACNDTGCGGEMGLRKIVTMQKNGGRPPQLTAPLTRCAGTGATDGAVPPRGRCPLAVESRLIIDAFNE